MEVKGIKYIGPIFDGSGYAKACRGNIMALHSLGIPVTLSPISFEKLRPSLGEEEEILKSLVKKDIDYNVVFIHSTPEFWHRYIEKDKINVGYTIWETTKLHPDWPKYINSTVDKVLVGSTWNRGVFIDSGVTKPIGIVPHGINVADFDGVMPYNIDGIKKDAYVFYSIFQWTERKNPLAAVKAYWYAFQKQENVALVLKTYRGDYSEGEKEAIRNTLKRIKEVTPIDYYPPIYYISNMLTEEEIKGLHARGDCYLSVDRGEGFGLAPFAAGACGKPVIATGFGGITEYATSDNSYLIDYVLTPVFGMPWSPWYRGDQLWAEPDLATAGQFMRHVYDNRKMANKKGKKLKETIANNFTWTHIGRKIISELEAI